MRFKLWFNEAVVQFANVAEAIKKTLEFVVTDGKWQFEPKTTHGLSGIKTVSVAGHFHCEKGHFFITAHTVAEKPIDSYDTISGQIDANSKIEIIASISLITGKNAWGGSNFKNVAERSNTSGGRLNTPYQLAQWVKTVIDNYWDNDDDDDEEEEDAPTPTPSNSQLVSV
jgi:hypothetical protein